MIVLSLDTSSRAGSAAIARDGRLVAEHGGDAARTHAERLPLELMAVLEAAGATLDDVDLFAVVTGPGSFTGLRVGIATIQGLAFARTRLVVPVSAFEALTWIARAAHPGLPIATWIDAQRGQVFAALFDPSGAVLLDPTARPPEATLEAWGASLDRFDRIAFAGDGAVRYASAITARLGERAVTPTVAPRLAGAAARIAAAHGDRGVRPHAVVPVYVRRPDAELARDGRTYD